MAVWADRRVNVMTRLLVAILILSSYLYALLNFFLQMLINHCYYIAFHRLTEMEDPVVVVFSEFRWIIILVVIFGFGITIAGNSLRLIVGHGVLLLLSVVGIFRWRWKKKLSPSLALILWLNTKFLLRFACGLVFTFFGWAVLRLRTLAVAAIDMRFIFNE